VAENWILPRRNSTKRPPNGPGVRAGLGTEGRGKQENPPKSLLHYGFWLRRRSKDGERGGEGGKSYRLEDDTFMTAAA